VEAKVGKIKMEKAKIGREEKRRKKEMRREGVEEKRRRKN